MMTAEMRFTDFNADDFLQNYWQKKPLLIRNPWTSWQNPLEPDELAGLALEPHIETRLIFEGDNGLLLEHGPLAADRFDALGRDPWTLLVQAVDHHVPAVAELLVPFRFIPNWRVDDVMVSFATTGGGVGAHFDQYDVFLIQGLGTRRWQLGGWCDDQTELVQHDGLKLLAEFEPTEDWVLGPGDILYVPPGLAHKGTSQSDDCMTYSVGFRAPSRAELIEGFAARLADGLPEDDRYADPDLSRQSNPGEIEPAALSQLYQMMRETLEDKASFARWFAQYATEPKQAHVDWRPEQSMSAEDIAEALIGGCDLIRNPASRFAFIREDGGGLTLAVDGQTIACTGETKTFAEELCASDLIRLGGGDAVSPELCALLERLHNQGAIGLGDFS